MVTTSGQLPDLNPRRYFRKSQAVTIRPHASNSRPNACRAAVQVDIGFLIRKSKTTKMATLCLCNFQMPRFSTMHVTQHHPTREACHSMGTVKNIHKSWIIVEWSSKSRQSIHCYRTAKLGSTHRGSDICMYITGHWNRVWCSSHIWHLTLINFSKNFF